MKSFKEYKNEAAGNRAIYATFEPLVVLILQQVKI